LKRKHLGEQFYDLLSKVLKYSPESRLRPEEALSHAFFDELREEETYTRLRKEYQIPDLFDFRSWKEISGSKLQELVPKWYGC
jgi:glycogen synthase kinase 3 beta